MKGKVLKRLLAWTLVFAMGTGTFAYAAEPETKDVSADSGTWKIQDWGGTSDIELQEGWIEEEGGGFTLNYEQIIADRGKEGLVIYDSQAEQYKDSTLELDITVSGGSDAGQIGFYSVAVLPRFVNGANCEGLAIHDKGRLQRAGYKDGNESWAWVRDDANDFLFDETYHLKMVTEDNILTAFAAKSGEELKELVSFELETGIETGGYGFRVWRGAKTIRVENIVRTEIVATESGLGKTEEIVPYEEWGTNSVSVPVNFVEGDSISSINDGEIDLTEGSHYSVVDGVLTISPDYFKGQMTKDSIALTVNFKNGGAAVLNIIREAQLSSWVFQKQGSAENVEPGDDWIRVFEGGSKVVINYGKVVEDAGEGWVIFDGGAPQYKDSVLEYDITFTDPTQGEWIAVAPAARVKDGANYEGFAITNGTALERTGRKDGSESYAGIDNLLGVNFEYNKTYHLKMETIGDMITVYLTRDGKEEKLTSFASPIGLDKGSYGFRIWRGGKTITIENIERSEIITSELASSAEMVEKADWGKKDVEIPITLGEGDSIASVTKDGVALEAGKDYSVNENTFVIKKEYIALQEDSFRIRVDFTLGSVSGLWIVKYDPDVSQEYIWTPDQGVDMWESIGGNGTFELTEDGTAMRVTGTNQLVNNLAPLTVNGEIEITFEALRDQDGHETGALFRADSAQGSWQAVASTDSINGEGVWDFVNGSGKTRIVWDGTQNMSRDGVSDLKVKVRYADDSITFWIDDQFANTESVAKAEKSIGQMGLYVDDKGDILVKKVVFREVQPMKEREGERKTVSIERDGLAVRLDEDFPRVADYTLNGKKMNGSEVRYDYVTINTVDIPATAEITKQDDTSVTYHVTPDREKTGVTFDVKFSVLEDHIAEMLILNVEEPDGEKVYSIGLPNQPLISANSAQDGARLDASRVNKNNRHFTDLHEIIAEKNVSVTAPRSVTIPVITADGLSASMYNNVLIGGDEFIYRGFELADGEISAGIWNTDFMYRGVDGEKLLPFPSEPDEENLYCRIAITEDTNGDDIINWQDGANALKKLTHNIIPGGDQASRSFFHVGYNFASGAQQPFLKVADNMKRLSNYMDGFGQQLVFKGYASEGHDSGHADYENINQRAGGAEDMRTAIAEADKINANLGIHINSQEAYPEAKMFNEHVTGDRDGWRWMDQSKIIRRYVDMLEGGFEERLDKLYEQVPDLDFVYVDCWGEDRWGEKKLIGTLLENGCELFGNENAPDFVRFGVWVHSTSGNDNSPMHQFVYNTQKDIYPGNGIYWGGYNRAASMMSWQHDNNINGLVEQFYTNQLPQKYLMCHEVERIEGDTGYFSGNITSGNYMITKDGNKLTNGTGEIFIPWYAENSETKNPDEAAKIYHWNGNGGATTWTLPESWADLGSVYLYRTTQNGKVFEEEIDVTDGQVTINAQAKTPYVVYPGEAEADTTEWSVGSPLKDTGFNSRDFSIWQKDGEADIAFNDDGNGVSILTMSGVGAGQVGQTMEGLKPGQKYRALVYAGAENGKTARITVKQGENIYENYLEQVIMDNQYFDNYAKGKKVQLMWVDFTASEETAEVILSADACENSGGKATFMETRIVETKEPDLERGYAANETFEYIEQGAYGIFSPESSSDGVPHLSETHEPYTDDTISGDWSLKMYGHYGQGSPTVRTSPATMRLEPNTEYVMEFDTMGGGKVHVQSEADGNDKVLEADFAEGHNKFEFTTGDRNDYIVRIESGARVLDNFKVYLRNIPVQYTVTFSSGEGSEVASQTVEEGALLTEPETPVREGYTFDGWYKDEAYQEIWDFTTDAVTSDITLYAKWQKNADKGELGRLLEEASKLSSKDYTQISWEILQSARNAAQAVFDDPNAAQEEVDAHAEYLAQCIETLVPVTVDKSDLVYLIKVAEEKKAADDYKDVLPAVKEAFEKALAKAKETEQNPEATQEEVDAAYEELREMVWMLSFKGNLAELKALVKVAEGIDTSWYKPSSVKAFEEALAEAKAMIEKENVLQDEIDAALNKLQSAMDGLIPRADKEALKRKIAEAENLDLDLYLDAGKDELAQALKEAKEVYENPEATDEEVAEAYDNLRNAVIALQYKPDKSKLEDLIGKVNGMELDGYTKESVSRVKRALKTASAVLKDQDATQEEVDAAYDNLDKAVKGLEKADSGEQPTTPENPDSNSGAKPETGSSDKNTDTPKTGDQAPIAVLSVLLIAAGAAFVVLKKRGMKKI